MSNSKSFLNLLRSFSSLLDLERLVRRFDPGTRTLPPARSGARTKDAPSNDDHIPFCSEPCHRIYQSTDLARSSSLLLVIVTLIPLQSSAPSASATHGSRVGERCCARGLVGLIAIRTCTDLATLPFVHRLSPPRSDSPSASSLQFISHTIDVHTRSGAQHNLRSKLN